MNGPIKAGGEAVPRLKASDSQVASAMRELSMPVYDLMHMTRITADMAERLFDRPDKSEGDFLVYRVHPNERDALLFALNNVEDRARSLKEGYAVALRGGMEQ